MKTDDYQLPDIDLLASGKPSSEELAEICRRRDIVSGIMSDLGIGCEITGSIVGPGTMNFDITLAPNVKIQGTDQIYDKLVANKEGLGGVCVGVSVPITGDPDIPTFTVFVRDHFDIRREVTFMRSIMESSAWKNSTNEIPVVIGFDVAGHSLVFDLTKAPHVLISGATGTGKSVFMNTLIAGLLFRFRPDELKLLMIDPKRVEFEDYRDLPHLIAPIIKENAKVPAALRWVLDELERRCDVMAQHHVKNIREFNSDSTSHPPMPYIVIMIEELYSLMVNDDESLKAAIESCIARIAQKGQEAGIHIVVSTQAPSERVITSVVKANLPSRICFQVRSKEDSKAVLDIEGAEELLGKGDMLITTPRFPYGFGVQGAYIPNEDIVRIVNFVSRQAKPEFSSELIKAMDECCPKVGNPLPCEVDFPDVASKFIREEDDEVVRQAIALIISERRANVSYLQRRLKIGYNRAVEILEELEARKLVSPLRDGGKREILANLSQE